MTCWTREEDVGEALHISFRSLTTCSLSRSLGATQEREEAQLS